MVNLLLMKFVLIFVCVYFLYCNTLIKLYPNRRHYHFKRPLCSEFSKEIGIFLSTIYSLYLSYNIIFAIIVYNCYTCFKTALNVVPSLLLCKDIHLYIIHHICCLLYQRISRRILKYLGQNERNHFRVTGGTLALADFL